jgi:hypothetical protein
MQSRREPTSKNATPVQAKKDKLSVSRENHERFKEVLLDHSKELLSRCKVEMDVTELQESILSKVKENF